MQLISRDIALDQRHMSRRLSMCGWRTWRELDRFFPQRSGDGPRSKGELPKLIEEVRIACRESLEGAEGQLLLWWW